MSPPQTAGFEIPSAPGFTLRQCRRARFRAITMPNPAILQVTSGEKHLEYAKTRLNIPTGHIGILPENVAMTVENSPAPDGNYTARVLVLDRAMFEDTYARLPALDRNGPARTAAGHDELKDSFERLMTAIEAREALPPSIFALRCREVITWLAEAGVLLAPAAPLKTADRVRAAIVNDVARAWRTAEIAHHLSMSEATLRRRLAAEKTTFRTILTDARLGVALTFLQTTDWTIAAIAQETGYDSPSRFAHRFRERFGLAPAAIRQPEIDRNGTAFERLRRAGGPAAAY